MTDNISLGGEELQTYMDTINKEMENETTKEGFIAKKCKKTLSEIDIDVGADLNGDADAEEMVLNAGTIIVDDEGNYYFQTSKGISSVKPLKNVNTRKKIPARTVSISTPNTRSRTKKQELTNEANEKSKPKTNIKQKHKVVENDVKNIKEDIEIDITNRILSEPDTINTIRNIEKIEANDIEINDCKEFTNVEIKTSTDNTCPYKCTICDYSTYKKILLTRHSKIHCDDRPFKCRVCERGFKTNASLVNHVNTHLGNKPHACTSCDKRFTTSGELLRHIRYRHTGVKPHKCTVCEYSSVEMSKLRRHMRCHTGERPYQCPHCTYASPDTFKLKRHLRTHTGEKPYECDICKARFTQSNSLKYHRLIHSVNEKPVFQCDLCPTTCGRKTDLRLHMQKLHSTDVTWPCNRCGKELPDRYSYKVHIKTHEGEKCYRCKYCPYASTTQRHLESHVLIHTNEKPFVCTECKVSFRQKQLLSRHINLHHNANYNPPKPREKCHKCPHCDRVFTFRGNLMRHMEVHDLQSNKQKEKLKFRLGRLNSTQNDDMLITYSVHGNENDNCDDERKKKFKLINEEEFIGSNDLIDNVIELQNIDEYESKNQRVLENVITVTNSDNYDNDDNDDDGNDENNSDNNNDNDNDEEIFQYVYETIETDGLTITPKIDKHFEYENKVSDVMNNLKETKTVIKTLAIKKEIIEKDMVNLHVTDIDDNVDDIVVLEITHCDDDDDDGHIIELEHVVNSALVDDH